MEIPGYASAVETLRNTLKSHPELKEKAGSLGTLYQGRRGLMVVDVVASRQRRYETYVVPKLLPMYESQATDLSLSALARNPPYWLPLRDEEAKTMSMVAEKILSFGRMQHLISEDEICASWSNDSEALIDMRQVFGIGPALLADSLKVDVRVINGMHELGIETSWLTPEGVLALAKELSQDIPCTLVELDQCLWHILGK
jgi:hypothetical protein